MNKKDLLSTYNSLAAVYKESFLQEVLTPSGKKGQLINEDYAKAICVLTEIYKANIDPGTLNVYKDLVGKLDPAVLFRLRFDQPCLACRIDELKKEADREAVKTSPNWIYTEKINGIRATMVLQPNRPPSFFGRSVDIDGGLIDYGERLYYSNPINNPKNPIAVDVELFFDPGTDLAVLTNILTLEVSLTSYQKEQICNSILALSSENTREIQRDYLARTGRSLLTIYLLHPLFHEGEGYWDRPIREGKKALVGLQQLLAGLGLPVRVPEHSGSSKEAKQAFLESILQTGGEGVVAHNYNALFSAGRSKDAWVKIKSTSSIALTDTVDGFITGYDANEKVVTHLEISTFIENGDYQPVHKIARVPVSSSQGIKLTELVETSPVLKPEMYGLVVEVSGSHFDVNWQLVTPKLVRFRSDKGKNDCKVTKEYLKYFTRKRV